MAKAGKAEMLEVLQQFRVVVQAIRKHYAKVEKRSGMTGAQLWALTHIAAHPGITVGELARAMAVHQSTASNLLERLVALEYVDKRRDGNDQRTVRLHATPRGIVAQRGAPQPRTGVLQQALAELPPASLVALRTHLSKLIELMRGKDRRARRTPLSEM